MSQREVSFLSLWTQTRLNAWKWAKKREWKEFVPQCNNKGHFSDPGHLRIPGKGLGFNRLLLSDPYQSLQAESVQEVSALPFSQKVMETGGFISSVTTVMLLWLPATTFLPSVTEEHYWMLMLFHYFTFKMKIQKKFDVCDCSCSLAEDEWAELKRGKQK